MPTMPLRLTKLHEINLKKRQTTITLPKRRFLTIDEESLKKLNDEQLMRLLEEAYNSKKKDEKITRASFNEILEDVHESLAVSDNHNEFSVLETSNKKLKSPLANNKFDSIATLRQENMDTSSSSYVTIPATSDKSASKVDPDADTSSTKTEVEEMELDTFSDLEDNMRAHENVIIQTIISKTMNMFCIFRRGNWTRMEILVQARRPHAVLPLGPT